MSILYTNGGPKQRCFGFFVLFLQESTKKKREDYMKTVNGVYTSAKIFTDTIEDYALPQIKMLCDNEAFKGCTIRIPGSTGV